MSTVNQVKGGSEMERMMTQAGIMDELYSGIFGDEEGTDEYEGFEPVSVGEGTLQSMPPVVSSGVPFVEDSGGGVFEQEMGFSALMPGLLGRRKEGQILFYNAKTGGLEISEGRNPSELSERRARGEFVVYEDDEGTVELEQYAEERGLDEIEGGQF